jgi:L-ascorbate metabolism protein UlaG (beta-lactamase superfamily)
MGDLCYSLKIISYENQRVNMSNPKNRKSRSHPGLRFKNVLAHPEHSFLDILRWQFTRKAPKWPKWLENNFRPELPGFLKAEEAAVTFVNHATCLIQTHTMNILTDPVWSHRVSPVSFIGPARVRPPGLTLEALPKINLILISHNHYDHLDIQTLKKLDKKDNPVIIVPLANKKMLEKKGFKKVYELDWWESIEIPGQPKITLVPAQHFSGRTLRDRNTTLWGGYIIEANHMKILFAGDTGYSPHFKEIFAKFGAMDVALLPIGAYKPRDLMKPFHMDPCEAVLAHIDLQAKQSIAIHFGTFQLSDEGIEEPVLALNEALTHKGITLRTFRALQEGETLLYPT